ncbi:hypothetical protein C4579_00655 [Candidatus Microgenomates bacterium]|nr:MAG: hypothetical protein C4579_00655 [Candidatus Microgenomates bacterium]
MPETTPKQMSRRDLFRRTRDVAEIGLGAVVSLDPLAKGLGAFAETWDKSATDSKITHITNTLVREAEKIESDTIQSPESPFKAGPLDYLGLGVFAKGIRELLPGGRGHIGADEYAMLGGLLLAKYQLGDEHTKKHIDAEIKSSLQALTIIALSSTAAQGMRIEVDEAFERQYQRVPNLEDKIALETMLASVLSPLGTTVAGAAALSDEAIDTAHRIGNLTRTEAGIDLDKHTVASLIDHISNSSGFILFGDPPWIAMAEKYGFENAIKFQFETMLPLALSSLLSVNIKLNAQILKEEGYSGVDLMKEATHRAVKGIAKNVPFLTRSIGVSLLNVARYAKGAVPFVEAAEQDPRGFELSIAGVFKNKLINAFKFVTQSEEFRLPIHDDDYHSRVVDHINEIDGAEDLFAEFLDKIINGNDPLHNERVDDFLHHGDFLGLEKYLIDLGIPKATILVDTLRQFEHNKASTHIHNDRSRVSRYLYEFLPGFLGEFYERLNLHRAHNALGAQLTDVLDVFPFQAGSVVFLSPIFHDAFTMINSGLESLEENGQVDSQTLETVRDAITYTAILGFSSMADNYVAEKIGLDLQPYKPHLITPAAIRGGTKFTISNMANLTLVAMDKYSLQDSMREAFRGLDQDVVGFAWAEVLDKVLIPLGVYNVPEPAEESQTISEGH